VDWRSAAGLSALGAKENSGAEVGGCGDDAEASGAPNEKADWAAGGVAATDESGEAVTGGC
jgi:hypothetical protein